MPAQEQKIISWEAPEYKHYEKNLAWYITLSAIAVLVIGYELLQGDIFAAIVMLILAGFVWFFSRQRPKQITISLTHKGIHLDNLQIPFRQIRHFWIVNNQRHKTLNLETTAYLNNLLVLELESQDPETLRQFLLQVLPEHEKTEETFSQKITHHLKF